MAGSPRQRRASSDTWATWRASSSRVSMGMASRAPGNVPVGVTDLTADEERRMEEQAVPPGRLEDRVEDREVLSGS